MTVRPSRPGNLLTVFCGLTFIALAATGCNGSREEIDDLQSASLVSRGQELGQTMKYIESNERFEMSEFRNKVNSGLNRWMTTRTETDDSWDLPELAGTLPESVRSEAVFTNLGDDRFSGNDAFFVQQASWIEQVARRILQDYPIFNHEYYLQLALQQASDDDKQQWQESDDLLSDIIGRLHPDLANQPDDSGRSPVQQLAQAMILFDWTVRNIQLLETPAWPAGETLRESALVRDPAENAWPAAAGAKGPGYVRFPWQTLTYGKGDDLERARVFVLLCEASGIPAAILAVAPPEGSNRPYQEWLPAVLVDGQLYLFDTKLGLPIPGERHGSIATLEEVRANPELLSGLDLSVEESVEKQNYRIQPDQLGDVTALIVAEPESISSRMHLVEDALIGDSRLTLTSDPDAVAARFIEAKPDMPVKMWHVPFSNNIFREQLGLAANKAQFDQDLSQKLSWLPREEIYVDNFVMFRTARNMYLRGIFETDRNSQIRSAPSYYFAFMYSDDEISQIENDQLLQMSLGIRKGAEQDARSWMQQLMFMKSNMELIRADAGFFLALAHYENGNPRPALNWLNRLPELDDDARWETWRPYQEGRAWEAAGRYDAAREAYEEDDSAQKQGSRIRARWMQELIDLDKPSS